jgi:hypothetical protein
MKRSIKITVIVDVPETSFFPSDITNDRLESLAVDGIKDNFDRNFKDKYGHNMSYCVEVKSCVK